MKPNQFSGIETMTPFERVELVCKQAQNPILTTNFRPYESAILHLVTSVFPKIPVIWCDSGYNLKKTYEHAHELIQGLDLNIKIYTPKNTLAYRNVYLGNPEVGSPEHDQFTEEVKLEPFKRAMSELQPDVWFTNLRKGQTALRDSLSVLSQTKDGVLKVSPFYDHTDEQLEEYLKVHNLPNELDYFDPTKVLANRECGLHLS